MVENTINFCEFSGLLIHLYIPILIFVTSIAKNTTIYIPILAINTSTRLWGPDAKDFRPERWLAEKHRLPEGVLEMPSVAYPVFLAGPRSCIGFRFAIIE